MSTSDLRSPSGASQIPPRFGSFRLSAPQQPQTEPGSQGTAKGPAGAGTVPALTGTALAKAVIEANGNGNNQLLAPASLSGSASNKEASKPAQFITDAKNYWLQPILSGGVKGAKVNFKI